MSIANTPLANFLAQTKTTPEKTTLKTLLDARNKKLGIEQKQEDPKQEAIDTAAKNESDIVPEKPEIAIDDDMPAWAKSWTSAIAEKIDALTNTQLTPTQPEPAQPGTPRFISSLIPKLCNDYKVPMSNHELVFMALEKSHKDELYEMDEESMKAAIAEAVGKYPSLMTASQAPAISGGNQPAPRKKIAQNSDEARDMLRSGLSKIS